MKIIKNYSEFKTILANETFLVTAKTRNCSVCRAVSHQLSEILKEDTKISVYELYLEDIPLFQGQFLVFTVPTIMMFYEGKEILRESRFIDYMKIERILTLL